jgi:hypothetical protein
MSVLHFVDRPHRLVVSAFSGQVTLDEIAAACTRLRHDRDFKPDYRQLADMSQVSQLKLQAEDINSIRFTYDPFSKKSRRAFVVADNDATLGTVKGYRSIVASEQFEIFPSMLDAISWLDLEVTVLQAVSLPGFSKTDVPAKDETASFALTFDTPRSFRPIRRRAKAHGNQHH